MSGDAWLTLAVVVAVITLLVSERLAAPLVIMGGVVTLLVTGVIDERQAFAGFSNPAPFTVAALYVVAGAVEVTGALDRATQRLLGERPGRGSRASSAEIARIGVPAAAVSGFINNTPVVSMVAPRVQAWARRSGRSPSLYLMPLSFATILGGLTTAIGTSTNLVVSGLLRDAGMEPLGLFEVSRMGVPVAIAGLVVLVLVVPLLLRPRRAALEQYEAGAREFTIEMEVRGRGQIAGRSVTAAGLRNLEGVFLIEVERDSHVLAPVSPDEVLEEGDRLVFAGNVDKILDLQRTPGLVPAEERHFSVAGSGGRRFFEAVVAPGGDLAGRTLKEAAFRTRYGGAVVAVHRAGERLTGKLGDTGIRGGDVLLVLSGPEFRRRWRQHRDFLVVAPITEDVPVRRERAWVVQVAIAGLLLAGGTGLLDLLQAALLAATALVVLGVITPGEARDSVDLQVILILCGSFGLGAAMAESGLAARLAQALTGPLDSFGDRGLLAGVLIATVLLTGMITNNASAVLMFPIAVATAAGAGLDPRPFAIAVMLGASTDFLTPIGYQTNTLVYGMGGYRFTDFTRVGSPLTVVTMAVGVVVIPWGWPLR